MNGAASNGIGWAVEEFHPPKGWAAVSAAHKELNQARAELLRIPEDGIERRVYEVLSVPA